MKKFKILLLSGGGIKGIATVSVLERLKEEKILDSIEKIIGSSIGSLIGLLLSLDYSPYAIRLLMTKIKYSDLQSYNIKNFINNFGFDDGSKFIKLVHVILKYKNIDPYITFEDFHKISKYHLSFMGTNVNLGVPVRFNVDTHPKMKVVDALRISTGFPLIFSPIKIGNHFFSDGGIMCPVECNGLTKKEIKESLAIVIHKGFSEYKTDTLDRYIVALISNMLDALTETLINKLRYKIIISVPLFSMDLNITDDQKEEMINIGKKEAENFINKIKLKKTKK